MCVAVNEIAGRGDERFRPRHGDRVDEVQGAALGGGRPGRHGEGGGLRAAAGPPVFAGDRAEIVEERAEAVDRIPGRGVLGGGLRIGGG